MKTPKTPIEFDYDLWTTEDGKCMVRVKSTGEVTEVDRKVMKMLRAEEKRIRRSMPASKDDGDDETTTLLSLDTRPEDESREAPWTEDPFDFTEEVAFKEIERRFYASLTEIQREIYDCVIFGKVRPSQFAKSKGVSASSVSQHIGAIRKRAKKYFKTSESGT